MSSNPRPCIQSNLDWADCETLQASGVTCFLLSNPSGVHTGLVAKCHPQRVLWSLVGFVKTEVYKDCQGFIEAYTYVRCVRQPANCTSDCIVPDPSVVSVSQCHNHNDHEREDPIFTLCSSAN